MSRVIDVVYCLGDSGAWANYGELRYSLRSIEQHFPNLGNVYLIGKKPDWATNVIHIPHPDCYRSNKDANLIAKALRACLHPEITEEYLWMNDDIFLLSDWIYETHAAPLASEDLMKISHAKWQETLSGPSRKFWARMRSTMERLVKNGRTTYNTEAHVPYLHNKSLFGNIMLQHDYGFDNGYCINALYFNAAGIKPRIEDYDSLKASAKKTDSKERITELCAGKWYLNYNDGERTDAIEAFLRERFPENSRFEK